MIDNRLLVIWGAIPVIVLSIIVILWSIWIHFPSVQSAIKDGVSLVFRRRSAPGWWKTVWERVKNFHTTKIQPRLKGASKWTWEKTKAHYKRGLFLCFIAVLCTAVILLVWWDFGAVRDNPPSLKGASPSKSATGNVIRFLMWTVAVVGSLVAVIVLFHLAKKGRSIVKDTAKGTWKILRSTKRFLKFFALSVAWAVVVTTFWFLREDFRTTWDFLWKTHQGLTIATCVLLAIWSFLWFFRENSKPISWATKIVGILILGLWADAAWDTDTVKNFRGDGIEWARGIGTGSSRGPSVHKLATGSNSFTITKDRWETFIVPAYHGIEYEAFGPVKFKRKTTRGKVEEFELVGGVRIPPAKNADGSPAEVSSVAFKALAEPTQVEIKALQIGTSRSQPEPQNSHIVFEGG